MLAPATHLLISHVNGQRTHESRHETEQRGSSEVCPTSPWRSYLQVQANGPTRIMKSVFRLSGVIGAPQGKKCCDDKDDDSNHDNNHNRIEELTTTTPKTAMTALRMWMAPASLWPQSCCCAGGTTARQHRLPNATWKKSARTEPILLDARTTARWSFYVRLGTVWPREGVPRGQVSR